MGKEFRIIAMYVDDSNKIEVEYISICESKKPSELTNETTNIFPYVYNYTEYNTFLHTVDKTLSKTISVNDVMKFNADYSWTPDLQKKIDLAAFTLSNRKFRDENDLRCIINECDYKSNTYEEFNCHLIYHKYNNLKKNECFFCELPFSNDKEKDHVTKHIQSHINNRFFCYSCHCKTSLFKTMSEHLIQSHYCTKIKTYPLNENHVNILDDMFIVGPNNLQPSDIIKYCIDMIKMCNVVQQEYLKMYNNQIQHSASVKSHDIEHLSSTEKSHVTINTDNHTMTINNNRNEYIRPNIDDNEEISNTTDIISKSDQNPHGIYCCKYCNFSSTYTQIKIHHNEKHENIEFEPLQANLHIKMEVTKDQVEVFEMKKKRETEIIFICALCSNRFLNISSLEKHWEVSQFVLFIFKL